MFSLLAFLGWAEGCPLPTESPRAELCLKVVVRASGKAVVCLADLGLLSIHHPL